MEIALLKALGRVFSPGSCRQKDCWEGTVSLGFREGEAGGCLPGQHLPPDCKFTAQSGSVVPRGDRSPCAVPMPCTLPMATPPCLAAACASPDVLCPDGRATGFLATRSHVAKELIWQRGCRLQGFICFPLCSPLQASCQQQISEASNPSPARQGKWTVRNKDSFYQFNRLAFFCLKSQQHLSASHFSVHRSPWPC